MTKSITDDHAPTYILNLVLHLLDNSLIVQPLYGSKRNIVVYLCVKHSTLGNSQNSQPGKVQDPTKYVWCIVDQFYFTLFGYFRLAQSYNTLLPYGQWVYKWVTVYTDIHTHTHIHTYTYTFMVFMYACRSWHAVHIVSVSENDLLITRLTIIKTFHRHRSADPIRLTVKTWVTVRYQPELHAVE